MNRIMKQLIFGVLVAMMIGIQAQAEMGRDTTQLKPKHVYGKEAKVVAYILDNNHYRRIQLNDSLSSVVLDQYINSLDNNKTYLTSEDLKGFEKFRFKIDDLTR